MATPHLITTVGGTAVPTLEPMLRHYRAMGIESFFINLHLNKEDDPIRETVEQITRRFGARVTETYVGAWHDVQQEAYAKPRRDYPSDWFLLADCDEFQQYDVPLPDILSDCEKHGWDHVKGCFLDRIAGDGSFPALDPSQSLEDQFPLGAMLTYPVMLGDPRKVTLVHGAIYVIQGQHFTYSPLGCPPENHYVPVHHFKWTDGIPARLAQRVESMKREGLGHWVESAKFLEYIEGSGGKIDIEDPKLLISPCRPVYEHWDAMKQYVLRLR